MTDLPDRADPDPYFAREQRIADKWRKLADDNGAEAMRRAEHLRGAVDLIREALTNSNAQAALSPEWRERALAYVVLPATGGSR